MGLAGGEDDDEDEADMLVGGLNAEGQVCLSLLLVSGARISPACGPPSFFFF